MDYLLLLIAALFGYSSAPLPWVIVLAGLLTGLFSARHAVLARQFAEVGVMRVFATSFGASFLNNLVFVAIAFCLGRGIAWLVG